MTDAQHFRLWFRLKGYDRFLIWISGEEDRVLVDAQQGIPCFASLEALESFARQSGIPLVDEAPLLHDLDKTAAWLATRPVKRIDCDNLLAAWNLFADVAASVKGDFDPDPDRTALIYMKLFGGGEVANRVLRPKDEPEYRPVWSSQQRAQLRATLRAGFALFEKSLVTAN